MKRSFKAILGVTLLEIMLVLAIAAMVIVMSIRYYQSASSSQQTNMIIQQIQGIISAVDGVTQGTGTYQSVNNSTISAILPATGLTAPWGGAITVNGVSATTFTIAIANVPSQVCPLLVGKLTSTNAHLTLSSGACPAGTGTTSLTYTYNSAV